MRLFDLNLFRLAAILCNSQTVMLDARSCHVRSFISMPENILGFLNVQAYANASTISMYAKYASFPMRFCILDLIWLLTMLFSCEFIVAFLLPVFTFYIDKMRKIAYTIIVLYENNLGIAHRSYVQSQRCGCIFYLRFLSFRRRFQFSFPCFLSFRQSFFILFTSFFDISF